MEKAKYNESDYRLVCDVATKDEIRQMKDAGRVLMWSVYGAILFLISIPFCVAGVFMAHFIPGNMVQEMLSGFNGLINNAGNLLLLIMVVWFIISPLFFGFMTLRAWPKYNNAQRFLNKHIGERANQIRIENKVAYERKLENERQRQNSRSEGIASLG